MKYQRYSENLFLFYVEPTSKFDLIRENVSNVYFFIGN